jgi:hypothetical protein
MELRIAASGATARDPSDGARVWGQGGAARRRADLRGGRSAMGVTERKAAAGVRDARR